MKIYKLDIDPTQPSNQIIQMQQNAAGVLSVNVTKGGESIRNLSCQVFDGENEIPACAAGEDAFKLDVGDTPKHYTVKATATPNECSAEYYTGGTGRTQTVWVNKLQLPAGTYAQDEFLPVVDALGSKIQQVALFPHGTSISAVNFSRMVLTPLNPQQQVWFMSVDSSRWLDPDEKIIATADAELGLSQQKRKDSTLSTYTYPAIGYYVNYQADTLIKPSQNANAFSEIDVLPTDASFEGLSADSVAADTFTLSGVNYVPTVLSVDGVAYTVLAAPVETPEPDPEPETDGE